MSINKYMKPIVFSMVLVLTLAACGPKSQPTSEPTQAVVAPSEIPTSAPTAVPTQAPPVPTEALPAETHPASTVGVTELKILWADWEPAYLLQKMGNMYEQETGVKVTVDMPGWADFYNDLTTDMAAKSDAWDMVMGESEWLGQAVTSGWFVDLTDFLASSSLKDSVTPATLTYYGEYPAGSGKYWAFPTESDATAWAYRKDLFENPDEQAAFQAKYGYDLAVPETYSQFKNIAEFFTRTDQNLYGAAIFTSQDYNGLTLGFQNTLFPWGGDWKDANNNVMGIVNSPESIEAVQFYRDLYQCCQWPGGGSAFLWETNDAMISGQAVMAMNYFTFFPPLIDQYANPDYYDKIGFFPNPKGPNGSQGTALGGQAMSIIAYISPERQDAAKAFIEWFGQEEVQAKWGEIGGGTSNANVLNSDQFLNARLYNPAFAASMAFVKDFWNIPIYDQLFAVVQGELVNFVVDGTGTAQETMDTIATEQEKILKENGYIQ